MSEELLAEISILKQQIKLEKERLAILQGERKLRIDMLPRLYYIEFFGHYDYDLGYKFAGSLEKCRDYMDNEYPELVFEHGMQFIPKYMTKFSGSPYVAGHISFVKQVDDIWNEVYKLSLQSE